MIQSLGGNPTPLPYAEVYTALKTGVVDGAENNWPSYESSRHYEVAKNYSLTEHSMSPELLVFSKAVWDTLGKEEQDVIRAAAKESVPYMRQLWDEREAKSRAAVEAGGATIISDIDRQGFVDASHPLRHHRARREDDQARRAAQQDHGPGVRRVRPRPRVHPPV